VAWRLRVSRRARKQLESLPLRDREYVVRALNQLSVDPYSGDVRKLTGRDEEWRLRVGQWRVRFTLDSNENVIDILQVLPRDRAYRD
jgi:mRNA interferase RelE/StbE